MSVIAVGNFPIKVKGDLEGLNCVSNGTYKTCYIKLSEGLDPKLVVEILKKSKYKYNAFVPNRVPDLVPSKKGKLSQKSRNKLGIFKNKPMQVFIWANAAILKEMQSKFNGLLNLSWKTGHRLLEKLTMTVMDRLKQIHESNSEYFARSTQLTMYYRKLYPHFGDFQLILSTLHALQDAAKVPRAQLVESDLIDVERLLVDKIPNKVLETVRRKYSDKIVQKIVAHIEELDAEVLTTDSAEVIARKKINKELKNISPYLNMVINQVIANQFVPQGPPLHRITIYGEPSQPKKSVMLTFLKKYEAIKVIPSDQMYNMIRCNVPASHITALLNKDGTLLGESKLIIRPSDLPLYNIPKNILEEIKAYFGETASDLDLELTNVLEVEDKEEEDKEEEVDELME